MFRRPIPLAMLLTASSSASWAAEYLANPAKAASWSFEGAGPARGTLREENGAIRIDIASASAEAWHIQVLQNHRPLQKSGKWILKPNAARTMRTPVF